MSDIIMSGQCLIIIFCQPCKFGFESVSPVVDSYNRLSVYVKMIDDQW